MRQYKFPATDNPQDLGKLVDRSYSTQRHGYVTHYEGMALAFLKRVPGENKLVLVVGCPGKGGDELTPGTGSCWYAIEVPRLRSLPWMVRTHVRDLKSGDYIARGLAQGYRTVKTTVDFIRYDIPGQVVPFWIKDVPGTAVDRLPIQHDTTTFTAHSNDDVSKGSYGGTGFSFSRTLEKHAASSIDRHILREALKEGLRRGVMLDHSASPEAGLPTPECGVLVSVSADPGNSTETWYPTWQDAIGPWYRACGDAVAAKAAFDVAVENHWHPEKATNDDLIGKKIRYSMAVPEGSIGHYDVTIERLGPSVQPDTAALTVAGWAEEGYR